MLMLVAYDQTSRVLAPDYVLLSEIVSSNRCVYLIRPGGPGKYCLRVAIRPVSIYVQRTTV